MEYSKESLLTSVLSNAGLNVINLMYPLLSLPIITRNLGESNYGVYAASISFVVLLNVVFELGLKMGLIKSVSDEGRVQSNINLFLFIKLMSMFISIPIVYFFVDEWISATVVLVFLFLEPSWVFQGLGKVKIYLLISTFSRCIAFTILLISNTFFNLGVGGFLIIYAIPWLLVCFFSLYYLSSIGFRVGFSSIINKSDLRVFSNSLGFYFFRLPNTIYMSSSVFIASLLLHGEDLSYFALAFQIYGVLGSFIGAVSISLYSRSKDSEHFPYGRLVFSLSFLAFLLYPVFSYVSELVIPFIFGGSFSSAIEYVNLFYISLVFQVSASILGYPYFNSLGKVNIAHLTMLIASSLYYLSLLSIYIIYGVSVEMFIYPILVADILMSSLRVCCYFYYKRFVYE